MTNHVKKNKLNVPGIITYILARTSRPQEGVPNFRRDIVGLDGMLNPYDI